MKLYRQGDVLVREVKSIPAMLKPIELDGGKVVLAYGEVTGHSHAIASREVDFVLNEQTLQRFLDVRATAILRHEEHAEIELPAGQYEVVIQREWTPGAVRNVAD